MKIVTILIPLCFFISGCGSINSKSSSNKFIEPTKGNSVDFYTYSGGDDDLSKKAAAIIKSVTKKGDDFCPAIEDISILPGATAAPAFIPILATMGKYIFDNYQDKKLSKLEALKKASKSTYSGTAFLSAINLKNAQCAVLVRNYAVKDGKKEGLIIIAKINHFPKSGKEAFSIEPTYIKAINSSAKTNKAEIAKKKGDVNHPKINLAIGLSVKAIGLSRNSGLPKLDAVGAGAVSVGNVELTVKGDNIITDGKNPCEKSCPHSDLIPHVDGDQLVSVSMSVTESGQIGIGFDQRKAEITAIKEAFGSAISESLKEALSDD